jgi:hypothetical protein
MEHLRISCAKRGFWREIYGIGRDANATYVKHNPGAMVQILFTRLSPLLRSSQLRSRNGRCDILPI